MADRTTLRSPKGPNREGRALAAADSKRRGVKSVAASPPAEPSYGLRKRNRNNDEAQENVVDGQRGQRKPPPESIPPCPSECC